MTAFLIGALLVAVAVVLFVLQPILTGLEAPFVGEEDELTEVEARKRTSLLALRDVEYDFATGKLDDSDYRSLRREIAREALAALETGNGDTAPAREPSDHAAAPPERTAPAPTGESAADPELEREIRVVRQAMRAGRFCPGCGQRCSAEARFCSECGTPVAAGAADGPARSAGAP